MMNGGTETHTEAQLQSPFSYHHPKETIGSVGTGRKLVRFWGGHDVGRKMEAQGSLETLTKVRRNNWLRGLAKWPASFLV